MTTMGRHGGARTVVGVFVDRDDARDAARELHDAGYKHTWIGTTRPHGPKDDSTGVEPGTLTGEVDGTDVVQGASGNILGKIGRFFAGEGYTLNEALREHGVAATDAAQLEENIAPGSSVLTVTLGEDDVSAGAQDPATVIGRCSGRLLTPHSGLAAGDQDLKRGERTQRDVAARRAGEIPTIREDVFTERGPVSR
jgi:hypothetical protein